MTWDQIAARYGTDKASGFHGYMDVYERLLSSRPVRSLLEIGVAHGKSLFTWREIFPEAMIVGVDIVPECRLHQRVGIAVLIANAADPAMMAAVSALHGPYDVIIDDGSHDHDEIRMAFEELYPRMAPGGVYIIEDLDVGHPWVLEFANRWAATADTGLIIVEHP